MTTHLTYRDTILHSGKKGHKSPSENLGHKTKERTGPYNYVLAPLKCKENKNFYLTAGIMEC